MISSAYAVFDYSKINPSVYRLGGKPLIISPNGNTTTMTDPIYREHITDLNRIFRKKQDRLNAVLVELQKAMFSNFNLAKNYIKSCLRQNSTILMWNGSTDRQILQRLGFVNDMLNMTAYDVNFNNVYYLNLYDFSNNDLILTYCLGYVNKTGRYLSLVETHNLICNNRHGNLNPHNPIYDVKLTYCIFHYLIDKTT